MKLSLIFAVCGSAVASANLLRADESSADLTLSSSEDFVSTYTIPEDPETDLTTLWNQLAAEAEFMKEQIAEERTTEQCKRQCDKAKKDGKDINKGRCRQNCDEINDKGNNSNTRNMSCDDCRRSFSRGSRKYERCMGSCRNGQNRCLDSNSCSSCRKNCSGNALDRCLDEYDCSGSNRNRKWNCSRCNNLSNRQDRNDCKDYCDDRNDNSSRSRNRGNRKWNCNKCDNLSNRSDRNDCNDYCDDHNKNRNAKCDCSRYSGNQRTDCRRSEGKFRNCAVLEE